MIHHEVGQKSSNRRSDGVFTTKQPNIGAAIRILIGVYIWSAAPCMTGEDSGSSGVQGLPRLRADDAGASAVNDVARREVQRGELSPPPVRLTA